MQFRLASTATKLRSPIFYSAPNCTRSLLQRIRLISSATTGRTADPVIHSGESEKVDADVPLHARTTTENEEETDHKPVKENGPIVPPKTPASSPKLESVGVNQPIEPIIQQKRRYSSASGTIEDVSCVGLDGTPWPEDKSDGWRKQRKEQEEDDKEYFKHHKASPLSEMEMADTRKPITKATDGTADGYDLGGGGGDVILFREEQLDTADDSLRRATEIWRQSAMRGDSDSPHGRVLRLLRGEDW